MKFFKKSSFLIIELFAVTTINLSAQNLTTFHAFTATTSGTNGDGGMPHCDLLLSGNTLYGTTPLGGSNGYGTVFSIKTDGSAFTVLHTFSGAADGTGPNKTLVLSGDTLYGLAERGTNLAGFGSVFSMDSSGGNFTNVYTFTDTSNGSFGQPNGGLILSDGTLYGTAYQGGISNAGTIFSLTTNGVFSLLHQFNAVPDGENPLGTLVLAGDTLYGTARNGGTNGIVGTVFSINTNGNGFTVLHTFTSGPTADGHTPDAGLLLAGDTLYGTAVFGGTNNGGTVFSLNTNGSAYSVLHSFSGADGKLPEGALTLRGDTLYGTTLGNGSGLSGTVFSIGANGGSFTTLHAFSVPDAFEGNTNVDGAQPYGTLAMAGPVLYGSTSVGGPAGMGTIFSLVIAPKIMGLQLAGTNAVFSGINAVAGNSYALLTSTNVASPLNQWTPLATNTLSGGGNFTFTATNAVNGSASQQFYILRTQ